MSVWTVIYRQFTVSDESQPMRSLLQYNMMTSSNGNILRVTDHLCGEFTSEFPAKRPETRSFDVFFDLHLNERLSKQSWGWWLETPLCPSWRHCDYFRREISSWKPPLWLIQWHLVNYSSYSFEDRIRLSFICWYPTFKSVSVTWRG